tara:strand:- start:3230 stop:3361 length:132 start_codon:yes stop_codon:yes gene_type:complete
MIQKTLLALILCCIVISCGKKGDPKYKNLENKTMIQTILIKKA